MKAGVSTTPWFRVRRPRRAAPSVASSSNVSIRGFWLGPADRRSLRTVRSASPAMLVVACTLFLVALTTVLHFEVLRGLTAGLPVLPVASRSKVLVAIFATLAAHAFEMTLYGLAFYLLVRHADVGGLTGRI